MTLKIKGLKSSVKALNKYVKTAHSRDLILDKLSDIGAKTVEKAHSGVMGIDHIESIGSTQDLMVRSDAVVSVEKGRNSRTIIATGENFVFHEFGSGIKHNSPRTWQNILNVPIPLGIAPIGQYGKKLGSQLSWRYRLENGKPVITSGYPAVNGFAIAINEMVANVDKVIKEVQK